MMKQEIQTKRCTEESKRQTYQPRSYKKTEKLLKP